MLFKKSFSLNSFSLKKAKGNLYSDFFQNAVNLKEAFRFFLANGKMSFQGLTK